MEPLGIKPFLSDCSMELDFLKLSRDNTKLLLLMDYDSGYVDGVESYSTSPSKCNLQPMESNVPAPTVQNFLLSEDALLEMPEFCNSLGRNLPCALSIENIEDKTNLFPSPQRVNCSVESQSNSTVYSELEGQTTSNESEEIPIEPAIVVRRDSFNDSGEGEDSDRSVFLPPPAESYPVSTSGESSQSSKRLTLIFSKADRKCYSVKRKYSSMTPDKKPQPLDPGISPDLFEDNTEELPKYLEPQVQKRLIEEPPTETLASKLDQKLLKRITKGMSGVLPPPSVTVIHLSVTDMLTKLKQNQSYHFWNAEAKQDQPSTSLDASTEANKSLLLSTDLETARSNEWPKILHVRCHGLHYNCGKTSEDIVDLCDKYQKRHVSAETQSTCTVFETQTTSSPSKRRLTRSKWGAKSPGRRLSHLARRRITFSSANLQAGGSLVGFRARQILVDAKKMDLLSRRKSPRKTPRKTPSKSPKLKTRTPSSSAKKKLALRFRKLTGEIEKSATSTGKLPGVQRTLFRSPDKTTRSESSQGSSDRAKRSLFQSPNRDKNSSLLVVSGGSHEKPQLRRALFASPLKGAKSPLKFSYERKRKRSECDDGPISKLARSFSTVDKSSTSMDQKPIVRCQSEISMPLNRTQNGNELSEGHKKKLLWAVNGALQSQNITNTHPQWKIFASVLIRVTRRFYNSQMATCGLVGAKSDVGTTERMQRIARFHVISVIKGKSVDEIVNEHLKKRARAQKPQGYIPPEDFREPKPKVASGVKDHILQDRANTIESWEKNRLEQTTKPSITANKIQRIRKVIDFGDDR
ncbi:hypothetical protein HUJ05_006876 [Dendroctonus ponderosae]|nr:hypothetical protein HUJ05_006876 [Dendroctonus ponderosae]